MNENDFVMADMPVRAERAFRPHPLKVRIDRLRAERQPRLDAVRAKYDCEHPTKTIAFVEARNGQLMYCLECPTCGSRIGNWIKKSLLGPSGMRSAKPRNRELQIRWTDSYRAELEAVRSGLWELQQSLYDAYVGQNSPEWQERREAVLSRDDHTCQVCKIRPAEQVHHLSYANLGDEPLEDLQAVCSACHEAIHEGAES